METTYSDVDDGGAFDENVIPELTEIAQTNEDFSGADPKLNGGYSLAGTTWTMGADVRTDIRTAAEYFYFCK